MCVLWHVACNTVVWRGRDGERRRRAGNADKSSGWNVLCNHKALSSPPRSVVHNGVHPRRRPRPRPRSAPGARGTLSDDLLLSWHGAQCVTSNGYTPGTQLCAESNIAAWPAGGCVALHHHSSPSSHGHQSPRPGGRADSTLVSCIYTLLHPRPLGDAVTVDILYQPCVMMETTASMAHVG